jgi:hypothetical protein
MSKKIAVCISGEMRYFNDPIVIDSYNKFVNILNPDVFISTWDHVGHSMNHGYINPDDNKTVDNTIANSIKSIYSNIKDIKEENYNNWFDSIDSEIKSRVYAQWYNPLTINSYAQIYKICDSINLKANYEKDNNFKYDVVIRLRADSLFVNHFDLNINKHTIYNINFGAAYYPNRIYDILFYGDSDSMDSLSKCFTNYVSLLGNEFHNGLCKRDACRLLYLQSILSELQVESVNTRLCDIYRGQGFNEYYNLIKSWGEYKV